jgi:hypothetical protein
VLGDVGGAVVEHDVDRLARSDCLVELSRKAVKVAALLRAITSVRTSPVRTPRVATAEAVP